MERLHNNVNIEIDKAEFSKKSQDILDKLRNLEIDKQRRWISFHLKTKITGGTMDREQWIHHIKSLRDTYSNMLLDLERGDEERVVFTVEAGIYRYDLDIDEELNDIDIIYKINDSFQIADIRLARVYLLKGLTKVMVKLDKEGHTLKELDVDKDSIYDPIRATFNSENGFISCYARLNKIVL